jgi:hypothetical protein
MSAGMSWEKPTGAKKRIKPQIAQMTRIKSA